jgi:hypothetical protein
MVQLPQQNIPVSQTTTITANLKRLYGPAQPIGGSPSGPETLYTVPVGMKTTVTTVIAANTDISSPPVEHVFSLSIGDDDPMTRIFSDAKVTPGEPFIVAVEVTLEAGEIIQAPATNDVTLTINGVESAV